MGRVTTIAHDERIAPIVAAIESDVAQVVDLAITVQQIPAPTFSEAARAAFVETQFRKLGLVDVFQDSLHNVYGRYPTNTPSPAAPVVVSAHLDTVFGASVDLTVKRNGRYIYGPGIGDNSTGVAGLLTMAQLLHRFAVPLASDVWFVANVCEEGLGDLRGMRALVKHFGEEAHYIVVEGGLFGQLSHQGIGVRRFRVTVTAEGGHSWGNFGRDSAVHTLAHIITAIDQLKVPSKPKTTYNVGVIEGGTSINTIAHSASLLLDLRSESLAALKQLETAVRQAITQVRIGREVDVKIDVIGDRPVGHIPRQADIVKWAEEALTVVGQEQVTFMAGSTDANIPLSQGLSAVCIGLTKSANAHRLDEYIDTTFLPQGLRQLLLLILAMAGFK